MSKPSTQKKTSKKSQTFKNEEISAKKKGNTFTYFRKNQQKKIKKNYLKKTCQEYSYCDFHHLGMKIWQVLHFKFATRVDIPRW